MRCGRAAAGVIAIVVGWGSFQRAEAQVGFRPRLVVAAGVTLPAGPASFTDFWGPGLALAAGLQIAAIPHATLTLESGYYRHGFDTNAFEKKIRSTYPNVNVSGNALYVIPFTITAEIPLMRYGSTRPYASIGFGYEHVDLTKAEVSGPQADQVVVPGKSDDAFGARFGLGVRTALTPGATLFVDGTYYVIWSDPDPIRFVPLRLGVRF
jgi:opacity protein-like surface antigen